MHFRHAVQAPLIKQLISSDDKYLVAVDALGGSATAYDLATGIPSKVSLRHTLAAAFLPGKHVVVLVTSNTIFFRNVLNNRRVHGRISAGRGRITEATLRYGKGMPITIFVRMTNGRTGVYALSGHRLSPGQRLPTGYEGVSHQPLVAK
jgi:hypothetical protein